MITIGNREAVIQNLEDAGCEPEMIQDFLSSFDKGQQKKQRLHGYKLKNEKKVLTGPGKV